MSDKPSRTVPPPQQVERPNPLSRLLSQESVLFVLLVIITIVLAQFNDNFLSRQNLLNQSRLLSEVGLVALPMTYIIITGGIDLSVGSILGLSAILLGYSWQTWNLPLPLAIVTALLVGGTAGFLNGLCIVRMKVPPLIMTLAGLAFYRGLAQGISQARSVTGYPDWFLFIAQGSILGLPTQLWVFVIMAVLSVITLQRTVLGRSLYALGHNAVGARFSGLPVGRVLLTIYTFSGLMAGLAAVIFVSRVTTTRSDMGTGLELDVIAAVVLGGTSIFGGKGSIIGTLIGLVFIQLLKNGLALMGVTSDATTIVIGSALIVAILLNNLVQAARNR
ncbi:MAG: ABC transporter permease [Deinococcota bacterium]